MRTKRWVQSIGLLSVAACAALATATPAAAAYVPQRYDHYTGVYSDYGRGEEDVIHAGYGTEPTEFAGVAHWYAAGEHLQACDTSRNGHNVRAEINYPDRDTPTRHTGTITDPDGSAGGCGDLNLDLPERTPVKIRLCVTSQGCSAWYDGRA